MKSIALLLVGTILLSTHHTWAYDAMATHFDGLGAPYGGCGVPQSDLSYQYFVALNVQNTPNDYTTYLRRPISDSSKVGMFNNGKNCGRYVQITLGKYCTGVNSGEPGKEFCSGGKWVVDEYTGATAKAIVADSCQDGNRWCRDDTHHLDIFTDLLKKFKKNDKYVDVTNKWGNRQVSWEFIKDTQQTDIKIYFAQNSQMYWPAMFITGFNNGISKVQQLIPNNIASESHGHHHHHHHHHRRDLKSSNGGWEDVNMNSDMGQAFILKATNDGYFTIRILDHDGNIYYGQALRFTYPNSCPNKHCGNNPSYLATYTKVNY